MIAIHDAVIYFTVSTFIFTFSRCYKIFIDGYSSRHGIELGMPIEYNKVKGIKIYITHSIELDHVLLPAGCSICVIL